MKRFIVYKTTVLCQEVSAWSKEDAIEQAKGPRSMNWDAVKNVTTYAAHEERS